MADTPGRASSVELIIEVWAGGTPGRVGRARLIATFRLWTAIAPSVDGVTGQSFFPTHPVEGISAGSEGAMG